MIKNINNQGLDHFSNEYFKCKEFSWKEDHNTNTHYDHLSNENLDGYDDFLFCMIARGGTLYCTLQSSDDDRREKDESSSVTVPSGVIDSMIN